MGKIFCLMGKSSSGKDTIFKELITDRSLQVNPVVLYTTRPKRINETDGTEYNFITENQLKKYAELGKVIEARHYNTVNGIWSYCTIDDGQIDLSRGNYLMIVTLEAYDSLKQYFGIETVIPLYIYVEDGLRLERALKRERQQTNPNYDELCRRFLADNEDFSEDRLRTSGIYDTYNNENLYNCIKQIREAIQKEIV